MLIRVLVERLKCFQFPTNIISNFNLPNVCSKNSRKALFISFSSKNITFKKALHSLNYFKKYFRESWCLLAVVWLCSVCCGLVLQFVIVVFAGHTLLLFHEKMFEEQSGF